MKPNATSLRRRSAPLAQTRVILGKTPASSRAAALACLLFPLIAAPVHADDWSTEVRRVAPPPKAASTAIAEKPRGVAPVETAKPLSLRAEDAPLATGSFFTARAALAKGAQKGPYVGAGLQADETGDHASGALIGGVAAPFLAESVLYGEMQQLKNAEGDEERRFWLGLRKGF